MKGRAVSKDQEQRSKCVFPMFWKGELYRFVVRISVNGFREYVGCFKTEEEAIRARDLALEKSKSRRVH